MNLKLFVAGATAALSLTLVGAPAHAYIFGYQDGTSGAELVINGGSSSGGQTLQIGFDANSTTNPLGFYSGQGLSNNDYLIYSYYAERANDPNGVGLGFNNFFVFDLSQLGALAGNIASASLRLWSGDVSQDDYLRLGSYSGSLASLTHGTGGSGAYNGLGSGSAYAYHHYLDSYDGSWQDISLNSAFISDANQVGRGSIAIGGTIRAPGEPGGVPEPTTWSMMILGFLGAGVALRARRGAFAKA